MVHKVQHLRLSKLWRSSNFLSMRVTRVSSVFNFDKTFPYRSRTDLHNTSMSLLRESREVKTSTVSFFFKNFIVRVKPKHIFFVASITVVQR